VVRRQSGFGVDARAKISATFFRPEEPSSAAAGAGVAMVGFVAAICQVMHLSKGLLDLIKYLTNSTAATELFKLIYLSY
jgi:hypothetical protein